MNEKQKQMSENFMNGLTEEDDYALDNCTFTFVHMCGDIVCIHECTDTFYSRTQLLFNFHGNAAFCQPVTSTFMTSHLNRSNFAFTHGYHTRSGWQKVLNFKS